MTKITKEMNEDKPSNPSNVYFYFRGVRVKEIQEKNKDLPFKEAASKATQQYHNWDEKEKAEWGKLFEKAVVQYDKEMEAWMKRHGLTQQDLDKNKKSKRAKGSSNQKPKKTKGNGKSKGKQSKPESDTEQEKPKRRGRKQSAEKQKSSEKQDKKQNKKGGKKK